MLDNIIQISDLKDNTFLLYFGLPNSPILAINDDDDISISKSSLEIESDSDDDNKSNEIVYKTLFSQLSHK